MSFVFSKYSANGNDFIVTDSSKTLNSEEIIRLCNRYHGIGADGLLRILPSNKVSFKIEMFNSDGSSASMCSNGVRSCLHFFHHKSSKNTSSYEFELAGKMYNGKVKNDESSLFLNKMNTNFSLKSSLDIFNEDNKSKFLSHASLNTGVEHLCLEVKNIESVDVDKSGKYFRHHDFFSKGVNVNFFEVRGEEVFIRTFERGVEGETQSCGSGILATAIFLNTTDQKDERCFNSLGGKSIVRSTDQGYEYAGKVRHVFSGECFL